MAVVGGFSMTIGLGLGLTFSRSRTFSPATLFASGEQGVWLEPSPDTCFTDTAGTTTAAVGDAVARINDSSGNDNHATQSTDEARPTLRQAATGEYYLEFDGVDDFLQVGTSTSLFNYLHNGTGCYYAMGVQPSNVANPNTTKTFFATQTTATVDRGFSIRFDDRASQERERGHAVMASRGVGGSPAYSFYQDQAFSSLNANFVVSGSHGTAQTPNYAVRLDGSLLGSGAYENTPTTGDAVGALRIGATTNNLSFLNGNVYGLVIVDRLLDAAEISNTETYVANKTAGVTL